MNEILSLQVLIILKDDEKDDEEYTESSYRQDKLCTACLQVRSTYITYSAYITYLITQYIYCPVHPGLAICIISYLIYHSTHTLQITKVEKNHLFYIIPHLTSAFWVWCVSFYDVVLYCIVSYVIIAYHSIA